MIDVSLMALYLGVALLAMTIRGRDVPRHMLHALGAGIVVIAVLGVLSRLRFEWFAAPQTAQFLTGSIPRLSYPLNYWNGLAALMALGIPVLLYSATAARSLVGRAIAGGCLPIVALCAFLTGSRGGVIEAAIGIAMFLLLVPERVSKLAVTAVAGGGGALLIAAADQRSAVREGMRTALAAHQGDQLIAIAIAAAIAVGLLVAAIALIDRHVELPRLFSPTRRSTVAATGAVALVCLVAFVAAGGSGFLHREWDQFKNPSRPVNFSQSNAVQRLVSVSGEGRYQYWQSAALAADRHPLTGTGAGTFVFWWAQHGTLSGGYVRDAHSLYLQSLAELGYPGLLLIVGVIGLILLGGVARVIRSREPAQRLAVAAATAAATAFAFSLAIDWIWLIPVLPISMIVLAAVIFAPTPGLPLATDEDSGAAATSRPTAALVGTRSAPSCALPLPRSALALPRHWARLS